MSAPLLSEVARPEIGRFYMVPCMKVADSARTIWMDVGGWVPVLGPRHIDQDHLDFPWEHYHIDWRFVGAQPWKYANDESDLNVLGRVLTNTDGKGALRGSPELRRIKCKREMPKFPPRAAIYHAWRGDVGIKWERLERAQAFACNKLKPGNICPHRGIDLTAFAQEDGAAICPGHGLRWNLKTGELMPRFAPGRTA